MIGGDNMEYEKEINKLLNRFGKDYGSISLGEREDYLEWFDEKIKPKVLEDYNKYFPEDKKSEKAMDRFIFFFRAYALELSHDYSYGFRGYKFSGSISYGDREIQMAIIFAERSDIWK